MSTRRISVVLPVYNEAENIQTSLRGLWAALKDLEHEILVCYDFDADTTLPAIAAMPDQPPTVRLVKNDIGKGAANAIRAGFAAATGDVVVTTMADLSDPPDRIPVLAEKMRQEGLAVVAGSRYMPGGSQTGGPLLKRTFSRWAGLILRALAGIGTHDVTSNFRAYSSSFLASTKVESKAGFEIALELTTKAHNAGLGVGEVASSWQDRSAGTSRFRMWKWMPNYLRWWMTAAVAPLFVWSVLLVLAGIGWYLTGAEGNRGAIHKAVVAVFALCGAGAILVLRRARGRTVPADAIQAVLWGHPWHARLTLGEAGVFDALGTVTASALHAWFTLGTAGIRAAWRRARARGVRVDQAGLGLLLLAALFVLASFSGPSPTASDNLDDGWQQIIGNALVRGDQWGRDVVFTFGPLGYFARGTYLPELYWWKVLWWEVAFKSLLALGFLLIVRRLSGPIEKSAYVLALFAASPGFDSLYFLAIAGSGLWLLATPGAGFAATAIVFGAMSLIALNKFTSFVLFGVFVAGIALARRLRGRWTDAAGTVALAAAVFVACWMLAGQRPWNIPAWIRTSLWIASGHNQAMSTEGPPEDESEASVLLGIAGAIALLSALDRPRDGIRWLGSALFAFGTFVAFKAGFTRHGPNAITFFSFVAVAPWFLLPAREPGALTPFVRPPLVGLRIACAFLALASMARLYGNPQVVPSKPLLATIARLQENLDQLTTLGEREERLASLRDVSAGEWDLPRTRAVVGSARVDHFFFDQGIPLLNGFDFRQRPAIQSYVAYTPELEELNAGYLRGQQAPEFVLYRHRTLDKRLPGLEDGLAQLVLARDYALVHQEKETLLLKHAPRPTPPVEKVLLERDVVFDALVDVSGIAAPALVAKLDLQLSSAGKLRQFLLRAPLVDVQVEFEDGTNRTYRFEPSMARAGFLLSPHIDGTGAAEQFFLGLGGRRVTGFRLLASPEVRDGFEGTYHLQILDGSEWCPRPVDLAAYEGARVPSPSPQPRARTMTVEHGALRTTPTLVRGDEAPYPSIIENEDVLVTQAPFELQFDLPAEDRRLHARFCVPESTWRHGTYKGLGIAVIARDAEGREEKLFLRQLDPRHQSADRGFLELDVPIAGRAGLTLIVRVRPGLDSILGEDLVAWSSIGIEK
ncbi:MAG: glycosyltransferase [Planctomycetota bacterium]|nr:glycosyltransferase [Planctomycetota bacterium]